MPVYYRQNKLKIVYKNQKIKKGLWAGNVIYSSGNIVTYYVDTNSVYQEEVDEGASCLSPKSFTPTKSGWTFVGWRGDTKVNSEVYSSLAMGSVPVALYAVFRQNVTVTYYDTSTTAKSTSGNRYYNNGAVINPSFTLTQSSLSGYTARGWSTSSAANGAVTYNNATAFTRDSNITLYGVYQQTITVNYYNYSTSASTATGIRYYNPGSASALNPSFTLTQATASGWTARGWSTATGATGAISYNNGATFTTGSSLTLYGMYQQTITVKYYNYSTTQSSATGTRYYNSNGNVSNPSFTLTQTTVSGWTARGWSTSSAGNGAISYNNGATFTRAADITLYGLYQQTITLTTYNGSGTATTATGTRYYSSAGSFINPTFSVTPTTLSGWSFVGWCTSSSATAAVSYSSISNTAFSGNVTLYGKYSQTITLSYSGNGNTGGSTASQSGTRYWNTGNVSNPTFTLATNGFTKSGYTWSKWAMGSAGGTQYANGASVTLSASTVFYAVWVATPHYFTPLNSVTWTKTASTGSNNNLYVNADVIEIQCSRNQGAGAYGGTTASATIPTGGCTKVRFTIYTNGADANAMIGVNGSESAGYGNGTHTVTFNVTGSSINVTFRMANSNTAKLIAKLTEIYFYN